MPGKKVVPAKFMEEKLCAAMAARRDPTALFIIARTDALEPEGFEEALRRAGKYLKCGVDGLLDPGASLRLALRRAPPER